MLHAYFTPIALCFVYTLWHFYAFSGTNLLTRCHSASSCFLLFLCFRKVTQEIFLELDETKAKVPIYLTQRRSPKERRRGPRGQPHHRVVRATPWPRHQVVWTPGPPPDIALPPINSLRRENPRGTCCCLSLNSHDLSLTVLSLAIKHDRQARGSLCCIKESSFSGLL
jgi:hypothetical protein